MSQLSEITSKAVDFRDRRDWAQFHKPKDVALSLLLEAAEVAEHFQWKDDSEAKEHALQNREALGDELSDVLYWVVIMAHDLGIDLAAAFERKLAKNDQKYPVDKARGRHTKYDKL